MYGNLKSLYIAVR